MRRTHLFGLTVFLLSAISIAAAPGAAAQSVQEITFDQALQIGLQQNPQVRRAETGALAARQNVELARAAFLPDVSLSLQPVRRFGLAFDQTTGSLQQETSDALSGSASASVNLFNGFRDVSDLRRRQLEQQAGDLRLERTREDVLFSIAAQFLAVVLDREIVTIRESALEAQEAQLEQIRQLVAGGVRPRADLLQQEAILAETELAVLQAENQLQLSETELVRLLQLDPRGEYRFVAPALDEADAVPETFDLAGLTESALDRRSDLRARELQISAAQEGIRAARSGYLPRVNLFASVGSSYSSLGRRPIGGSVTEIPVRTASGEDVLVGTEPLTFTLPPGFESTPFGDQFFRDNRGGSVGLTVSVPVFDRMVTRSSVRQAQLNLEEQRIARQELEQDVAVQVRQSYLDYQNAQKRLDVTARQVAAASAALAAEQDRYDLGASTLVELSQARSRMVEAESARAQAVAQFIFQRRRLDYQAGLLDTRLDLFD